MFVEDDRVLATETLQGGCEPRQVDFMEAARRLVEQQTEAALLRIEHTSEPDPAALALTHVEHSAVAREIAETDGDDPMRVAVNGFDERARLGPDGAGELAAWCGERFRLREGLAEDPGDSMTGHA